MTPARLAPPMRDEIVAHARAVAPVEACGLIAGTAPVAAGGTPTAWHPVANRRRSELRFEMDPDEVGRLLLAFEARGEVIWAIVHSHVQSAAVPSPSDVAGAAWWPGVLHVLVSLEGAGEPRLRAWRIEDGSSAEVPLALG
jgi:[CysO sulfur-carrier protein]-S-L-cysteine hydrolase